MLERKNEVKEVIDNHLNGQLLPTPPFPKANLYTQRIDELFHRYDEVQGIPHTVSGDTLIRDARETKPDAYTKNRENADRIAMTMQFLNNCRGAKIVCELENKEESKPSKLDNLANTLYEYQNNKLVEQRKLLISALKNIKDSKYAQTLASKMERKPGYEPSIKELNTILVQYLKAQGIKNAHKKVAMAAEFGSFEQTHYNTVTISKVGETEIIESSVKVPPLTGKLKQEYEQIAEDYRKGIKTIGIKWFDKLEPFEKKLVAKYAGDIASGQKLIPTQLLKILPGLRNSYLNEVEVREQGKEAQPALSMLRSGAPAYRGDVEVTQENIKAAQTASKELYDNAVCKFYEINKSIFRGSSGLSVLLIKKQKL